MITHPLQSKFTIFNVLPHPSVPLLCGPYLLWRYTLSTSPKPQQSLVHFLNFSMFSLAFSSFNMYRHPSHDQLTLLLVLCPQTNLTRAIFYDSHQPFFLACCSIPTHPHPLATILLYFPYNITNFRCFIPLVYF